MNVKARLDNLERKNKPTVINLFPVLLHDAKHGTSTADGLINPDIHGEFMEDCERQLADYKERHYVKADT
ncbi:MAG: hypothetical protein B7X52_06640 [Thiotrichales bacterium 34-46-19]|nr:MAG: hypothetical protein B7X52_06640 [Thiotrichales bacterium 34-46-19]